MNPPEDLEAKEQARLSRALNRKPEDPLQKKKQELERKRQQELKKKQEEEEKKRKQEELAKYRLEAEKRQQELERARLEQQKREEEVLRLKQEKHEERPIEQEKPTLSVQNTSESVDSESGELLTEEDRKRRAELEETRLMRALSKKSTNSSFSLSNRRASVGLSLKPTVSTAPVDTASRPKRLSMSIPRTQPVAPKTNPAPDPSPHIVNPTAAVYRKGQIDGTKYIINKDASQLLDTTFEWKYADDPSSEIGVGGSWNDWKPIWLELEGEKFICKTQLPVGNHMYRFYVDGKWKHDPNLPTKFNVMTGTLENIIQVGEPESL
eukprot:TRINITY_DN91_c0_g1_i1.p1 TRINITY_DN91_c0_g1~~TRINITY_DN91_c0_g1_i1.p1  ORF type:complete len:323 (+),score=95.38 TRINITY_DN91_c0_g1_i1:57-1025(+)